MDFAVLGVGDLGFDGVGAGVERGAEFLLDGAGRGDERRVVAEWQDADLLGGEPEGKLPA